MPIIQSAFNFALTGDKKEGQAEPAATGRKALAAGPIDGARQAVDKRGPAAHFPAA